MCRRTVLAVGVSAAIAFVAVAACQSSPSDVPRRPDEGSVREMQGPGGVSEYGTKAGDTGLTTAVRAVGGPSVVTVQKDRNDSFQYLVAGKPQVFIGMGYNPIYRHLSHEERAANYERDFRILSDAGVNHIIGWDFDKGYEQDKFDELTLDMAFKYGIGVVMPFYVPPDGNYRDEAFLQSLLDEAAQKIARFKDHPALRMWGVGNEVMLDNRSRRMWAAFWPFYLRLADLFHRLDPNHPVLYREAEGYLLPAVINVLRQGPDQRPWLIFGLNIYSLELEHFLDSWTYTGFERPLLVSEFGAESFWAGGRPLGYLNMWRSIRAHSDYVLGGAPYVWTIEGPEPTDTKWGLMDAEGRPVDDTFEQLAAEWCVIARGSSQCR